MDRYGNHVCGLFYTFQLPNGGFKRRYLPPVQLKSHTTINPVCFTTQLTQTFHNSNSEVLPQVRYTFPLYDGVAVNGYTISYASKVLKGVVKQKDDAKKTYQAAVDRGETAGLLESLPAGVFGVTIGNVPANTDVIVDITYCGELKHDAAIDGLRYMLPTSVAPRYGNYPGELLNSNAVAKGGISITVDLDMATSAIRKVQSPSHPIAVSMGAMSTTEGGGPFKPSQASATLTLGSAELADDFVLQLLIDDISKPQAILETHPTIPNHRALMTTLVPKFTLEAAHPEIVFIADQSGSMSGSKNEALVSALKVFLKSLPLGVRFNIVAFGSTFNFLFPKSQAYNETNLTTAIQFVESFSATYGGTEILEPIKESFKQRLTGMPLEVMLLTDGEVWGEDAVFKFINEQIHDKAVDARVFALGIGGDVSHTLVEGVARAGNGFAQFVTQNEDTGQKVIRMLKGALYAHTKDYSLEVNYDERDSADMSDEDDFEIVEKVNDYLRIAEPAEPSPKKGVVDKVKSFFDSSADLDKPTKTDGDSTDRYAHLPSIETPKLFQAPSNIPPLFPFNRTTLYLLVGPESAQRKVSSVTLRATCPEGPLELNIPVHYSDATAVPTIHQLAARKAVQELEEGRGWIQAAKTTDGVVVKKKYESRFDELVGRECVRLGEKFQVVGKWTSFVAVEEKNSEAMEVEEQKQEANPPQPPMDVFGGSTSTHTSRFSSASFSRYVDPSAVATHSPIPTQASGGLFGNVQSGFGSTGGLFGNVQSGTSGAGGLFGSSSGSQSGPRGTLFGNVDTAATGILSGANTGPGSGAGPFNNASDTQQNQSGGSLFGNPRPETNLFNNSSNHPQPGGLFGNLKNAADMKPTHLFGNAACTASSGDSIAPVNPSVFGSQRTNPGFAAGQTSTQPCFGFTASNADTSRQSAHAEESTEHCSPSAFTDHPTSTSSPSIPLTQSHSAPLAAKRAHRAAPPSMMRSSPAPGSASAFRDRKVAPELQAVLTDEGDEEEIEFSDEDMGMDLDLDFERVQERGEALDSIQPQQMPQQMGFQMAPPPPQSAAARRGYGSGRTKEPVRKSSGGMAPRKQLVSMAARRSAPMPHSSRFDSVEAGAVEKAGEVEEAEDSSSSSLTDSMHALISLQTFSGAFAWDAELFAILGIAENSVSKAGQDEVVMATALAIAWLEKKVPGQKGVWEMIAEKAKGWMKGQGVDVDGVVGEAGAYFSV